MADDDTTQPTEPMRDPPPPSPVPVGAPAPLTKTKRNLPEPIEAPAPARPNLAADVVEGQDTVTLTIDGRELTVRKGTNVLEAAKLAGQEICHFCYHQGLSIAASCRQCLVEIEKSPKLMPSCQVTVGEGMVVRTQTPAVLEARRALLEFTLVNHPIDCPICDKAGECTLQRHYMDHDHAFTRVDVAKVRKPKRKDIGRDIILDAERCILCSRCIRFCEEIPQTAELTMVSRGDREEIDVAKNLRLDNPYSVNVVDICPVGALTSKDFRFQIRAWELSATETTCSGCATGCRVELHTKHEEAYRVVPSFDPTVNGHWMCDDGRLTYKELASGDRVRHATVDGQTVPLRVAIEQTAERLAGKKAAVIFAATATNEANLALAALAELLDAERFILGRPPGEGDEILRDRDKNPNTRGAFIAAGGVEKHEAELALELAGRAYDAVVFLDDEGELSDVSLHGLAEITSVCLADRLTPLAEACTIQLPAASWAEIVGTYTNRQGRLRLVEPAWRAEGDRAHRGDLLRDLVVALDGADIGSARQQTEALAKRHEAQDVLDRLAATQTSAPTLLRFGNSRG